MTQVQDKEDLRVFLEELNENLSYLDNAIIALEEHPDDKEILSEIFRVAHTVKGNAGFLDLKNLVDLGHTMENVFQEMKKGNTPITRKVIDILLECKDTINTIGQALAEGGDPGSIPVQHLIQRVNGILESAPEENTTPVADEHNNRETIVEYRPGTTLVRIWISPHEPAPAVRAFLVETRVGQIGQIVHSYPPEDERELPEFANSDREIGYYIKTDLAKDDIPERIHVDLIERIEVLDEEDQKRLQKKRHEADGSDETGTGRSVKEDTSTGDTVRIPVSRLDVLLNLVGELVIANSGLLQIQEIIKDRPELVELERQVRDRVKEIFRISADVQELVMKSRLVPIGQVFSRFKRFVRDYSGRSGKKIQLTLLGEETEIDKKIIDEMIKPLTHLVRNALDHGIEEAEVRVQKGKPATGQLKLHAFQEGNYINVVIEDDGKGLDYVKIVSKAIQAGILTKEQASSITEDEAKMLIFHSGLSTKDSVDDLSGRGIGMDIVKRSVEMLNGTLDIQSKKDQGTKIIIKLPLTLAIINALIVTVGDEKFSIPMASIVETQKVTRENILMIEGSEMVRLRDTLIPLIRLNRIFNIPSSHSSENATFPVIVVEYNDTLVGLLVDQFLTRHEMVIKSLAEHYRTVEGISGASILGDGDIILILDVHGIIQIYRQLSSGLLNTERNTRISFVRHEGPILDSIARLEKEKKRRAAEAPTVVSTPAPEAEQQDKPEQTPMKETVKAVEAQPNIEPSTPQNKQSLVDELVRKARADASPLVDISSLSLQESGALSFHQEDQREASLKKLKELFDPDKRDLLKEWLRQGNIRAIQGIQALTGSRNIKLDKSKGRHIHIDKIDTLLNKLKATKSNLVDFMLPMEPLDGAVHFILTTDNAARVVKLLLTEANLPIPDEIDYEPIMEVTNILGSSYTNSLTHLTDVIVEPGVPTVLESKEEIIESIQSKLSENAFEILYIENQFLWEHEDIAAELLILIPEITV